MDFNSLKINVVITVLVLFMVFLLPWADRRICRRLRLNLEGGLSDNPNADRLLRLRQRILTFGLFLYFLLFAWLVLTILSQSLLGPLPGWELVITSTI